ncbi:MAG: M14 family metallocarboxypeptidase [Clostridiales bacterium]|nr:M14 family metallocarboxypeptidase [Clostridiales bacterium]
MGNTKNRILCCGGFHGSEYLTVLTALKFFEECAEAIADKAEIGRHSADDVFKNRGLTVVPCVNPDGVEIALHGSSAAMKYKKLVDTVCAAANKWQANARGVDINHNFNAGWKALKKRELSLNIKSPSATRFGGTFPESEPETRAVTNLCRKTKFECAIALHSQGREIYCSFGEHTPVKSFRLASALSQVSGYNIAFPEEIATGGGFKDWFIENFKRPALTIEMGLGENPLPLSDFESEYKIMRNMLSLVMLSV